MNGSKSTVALLMGDIVESEKNIAPDTMHRHFNEVIEQANIAAAKYITSPLTITLGDEFQGFFRTLPDAASTARRLRLQLIDHDIDCRFVIGYAFLDTPINPDRAWNMMGRGLGRARAKLEKKNSGVNYSFSLPDDPLIESLLDAIGIGLSVIERNWTKTQFQTIRDLSDGHSAKDVAQDRGVTVHNIYKVRAAGEYDAYTKQWQVIGAALTALQPEVIK